MSNEQNNSEEITLKELILKIIEFKNEVLKHWKGILLFSILISILMIYRASNTAIQYEGELTFMVSDDEGGDMSGMAGLLGQFGFLGNTTGNSNPEKMLELLMTRKITEKAIFHKVFINKKKDFLANHLIENLESNKKWAYIPWYKKWYKKQSSLKNFRFLSKNISSFSKKENSALKKLHSYIAGKNKHLSVGVSEMTGIMKIGIQTTEEELSIHILIKLYRELSDYYYNKTIERTKTNYTLIKTKTDSLFSLLSSKEYQLARFKDSNIGLITRIDQLDESRLYRDVQKLSIMYGEASKNLELAEFSFNLKKPYIQEIDIPIAPLLKIKNSIFIGGVLGMVLGVFLSIFYIIIKKIIRDALS